MEKVKLSIIILSYNTKELLKQCLESVISNQLPVTDHQSPVTEIIIVDNGSTDGSVDCIKEFTKLRINGLTIKAILNKENLGFAKGNNRALRQVCTERSRSTQGKKIFFLNSDTIVKKGAINKLMNFMVTHPEVAATSPLLLNQDGSIQKDPCYLKFPSPVFVFFYYNKFLRKIADKFFPKLLYSVINFETPLIVDQLSGAALMIRKGVINELGGFDENFSHFFEDVDLSWRLKKAGYKLFLVPQAKIIHLKGKSLEPKVQKEGAESFYYLNFKSLFQFCQKNYPFWKVQLIKTIIFLNLALRLRFSLIKKLFFL